MQIGKTVQLIGLFVILSMVIPFSVSLGAEGGIPIKLGEMIVGPTIWAVGVVNCDTSTAALRIKSIEGCSVATDHLFGQGTSLGLTACPKGESDILNVRLPKESVLGFCKDGINTNALIYRPIITKVKNYKEKPKADDPDVTESVSFDAQIQFVVSDKFDGDVCK